MKAAMSKMSPHNVLSCRLKFCTASAHLTFSEASPPTCNFKGQRRKRMCHALGYRAGDAVSGCAHQQKASGHRVCDLFSHVGFAPQKQAFQKTSSRSALCITWVGEDDRL